jgi:peptidyl-prolyl cis-trans isomerase C
MLDRIRNRVRPANQAHGKTTASRQRRISRREREARQRRMLYIGAAVAGTIAVLALLGGAFYTYWWYPRDDLAVVNGRAIERRDYWKVRELVLRQTITQQQQQLQTLTGDQANQVRQAIELAAAELDDVKDAPISSDTLQQMVDDRVVVDSLDDLGITITDDEVEQFIDEQFAPIPLVSPTATSTVEPTAAAWATATASAEAAIASQTAEASRTAAAEASATAAAGSPTTSGSPAATGATGTAPAGATATAPAASPTAAGSPTTTGSPAAGSPTVTASPTTSAEQALATSQTTFRLYERNYLDPSGISRGDYERLIARPSLARDRIRQQLVGQLPARAEQIHAAHILVLTREAADAIVARLATEDFADVARDASIDGTTAGTGGDLGWFPRQAVDPAFADAAFALAPDSVSAPVPTKFGWHVIKVFEKDPDRPVSLPTLQQLRGTVFTTWLDSARANAEIQADIALPDLVNTTTDPFQPPADAPPLPTPTPSVVASPEATGSPPADGTATSTP